MNSDRYRRSEQVDFAKVGDEVVALHVKRGSSYGMENVTAAVWRLLSEPKDLEGLCRELLKQYEIDPETCRAQVARLLGEFESEGLVERFSPPVPTPADFAAD